VFADGPVLGLAVLVHGVLGGVGALAAQLAHWAVRQSSERCASTPTWRE
jgi:NADPH:quinone reductase-like Zn-dependent oxidoreductase